MIKQVDKDMNGTVEFDEFLQVRICSSFYTNGSNKLFQQSSYLDQGKGISK